MHNKKWLGLLLVISGGIFWGASGTLAQYMFSTQNVSSLWMVGTRLISAGVLLLLSYLIINKKSIWSIWKDHKYFKQLLVFSFLGMLPSQLFYFLAIKYGNAATATILQYTSPVFILGFIAFRNRRLPYRIDILSIIMAIVGTFLLATRGDPTTLSLSILGLMFGLGSGIANASYTLIPVKLLQKYDPKLVCGWAMFLGSLPLMPFMFILPQPTINGSFILELLFIIVIGTMLSYLFYVSSLQYLKPEVTGVLGSFEPLTATFLSFIFLNLNFNWIELLGAALIIIMSIIQSLSNK